MKPVARPISRVDRLGGCGFQLVRRDLAIAVLVEAQDEHARLVDEFFPRNLAVLIFIEIAELGFREARIGFLDRVELLPREKTLAVLVGRGEQPLHKTLPFLAGENAVVIGVPGRRPVSKHGVNARRGLGQSLTSRQHCQSHTQTKNGFSVTQIASPVFAAAPRAQATAGASDDNIQAGTLSSTARAARPGTAPVWL